MKRDSDGGKQSHSLQLFSLALDEEVVLGEITRTSRNTRHLVTARWQVHDHFCTRNIHR